jgi:hypothetical protein
VLFGGYRKGDANDPDRYIGSVIAVLSDYPEDTVRYVTDPRTGVSNKFPDYMPNAPQVRQACEDHYGPTRRAFEVEAKERRQLEERKRLMPPEGPRKTYDELIQSCVDAGLDMGKRKKEKVNVDAFLHEHGMTRAQFDALPNAPDYKWK